MINQKQHNKRADIEKQMHHIIESEDAPFIVLDTETTGLPKHIDFQVVEVATIDRCRNIIFNSLIRPDIAMPKDASLANGITDEMLTNAPGFREIWPQLLDILRTHKIYCYNTDFDKEVILRSAKRFGIEVPAEVKSADRWSCIMELFAQYQGEWSNYWGNWKWQPLSLACQKLGVKQSEQHRAYGDALSTLKVMEALAARHTPAQLTKLNQATIIQQNSSE